MDDEITDYNDNIQSKYRYWSALRMLGNEHKAIDTAEPFIEWVKNRYGFEILLVDNYSYSADYVITNPSKYMFFQLKYNIK